MKIYLSHDAGAKRTDILIKNKTNILMSYYLIITPEQAFDAEDCFYKIIKEIKKNENLFNIQKH